MSTRSAGLPQDPTKQRATTLAGRGARRISRSQPQTPVPRRGGGGRSAARLFRAALGQEPPRPARRTVERHLGWACRDPTQIGPTHALNPTAGGGSAPRTPAPLLWCRAWPPCRQGGGGRRGPRLAARAILPALGLACPSVPALCWSPCGCGRAVGRVAPVLGGSSGLVCGVCCGWFLLSRFVPRCRRAAWASSALGSLVASAGWFGAGRWGLPLARAGIWAGVLRCRGRGRVLVARRRCRVRVGLVGLGGFPAGRSALCRRGGSGVRGFRAGGRPAVCPAVASSGAARSGGLGAGVVGGRGFLSVLRGGVAAAAGRRGALAIAPVLLPAIQTAAALPLSPG